jgi:3-dehydroquinate synthetase
MEQLVRPADAPAYPCVVGAGWGDLPERLPESAGPALVVSDPQVWSLHGAALETLLAPRYRSLGVHLIGRGESAKTLDSVAGVAEAALELGIERNGILVAFGGGVVGDVTGFAAAITRRGCRVIQLPTTLLAQVDASIGGKTGCNSPRGKNLLGVFHHPSLVWCNLALLRTLDLLQWRSGLGELAKAALLSGDPLLTSVEAQAEALSVGPTGLDGELLAALVARAQNQKVAVVSRDARETGERAVLNLGHTFGHALELGAASALESHGQAVAVGIRWVTHLGQRWGLAEEGLEARVSALLEALGLLPTAPLRVNRTRLWQCLQQDKKRRAGMHRLVMLRAPGEPIFQSYDDERLNEALGCLAAGGLVGWQEA